MNIISISKELFQFKDGLSVEDKINSFNLEYQVNNKPLLDKDKVEKFINVIPETENYRLSLRIEDNSPVVLTNNCDVENFVKEFEDAFLHYETNESIYFSLKIDKKFNDRIRYIYSIEHFENFWGSIKHNELLDVISSLLTSVNTINFVSIEKKFEEIETPFISFNNSPKIIIPAEINDIKDNCHFGNFEDYKLSPNHFHIINRPKKENAITIKLDVFKTLFSIISIFDISSIKTNKLYYKLNGYKTFEDTIEINDSFKDCSEYYYEIFKWIYSSKGNVTDKIGVARNILSIYLDRNILNLEKNIILSIKSTYNTYLKENVNRYLEIRNRIFDEVSWISQKSSEIIEKYLMNYQKSILVFLTFFISVFILRIINNGQFENVFTKDATILSFGFIGISLIFQIFSIWNLFQEKNRLHRKYNNLKNRYKDLLLLEDIEKILNSNSEFNYEMSFINKRFKAYTLLWLITILVLLSVVLTISEYFNWHNIIELTKFSK